ncbi:MAG: GAF domain-containing protein [Bacteroidales bacterium]|nr:GAF domain-containing protein [Bacteroidales bacterium]
MISKNINFFKGKILLLIILLAVYTASILLVNALFSIPESRSAEYGNRIEATGKDILRLKIIQSDLMLHYRQEINSFESQADQNANEADATMQRVTNEINDLSGIPQFRKDTVLKSLHALVAANFSAYSRNFSALFRAVRERGNLNTGLISQWLNLSNQMDVLSSGYNGYTSNQLSRIRQLEINYLQSFQSGYLETISGILEEDMSLIDFERTGVARETFYDYITLTNRLIEVNKRIQTPGDEGLLTQLSLAFDDTLNDYNRLVSAFQEDTDRSAFLSRLTGYLLVLIIFSACVVWLMNASVKLIVQPLSKAIAFSDQISRGILPEKELELKTGSELGILAGKLNQVVSKMKDKLYFIKALNEKKFDVSLTHIDDQDKLGNELLSVQKKMVETTEEQAKNNAENMRRRYINEGLARFAEILRMNNNDIHTLGDNFIQNTVRYLNAIQGGLFLLNENHNEKATLSLVAAFAYDRKKYLEKTIEIGEGLIGTCAIEKSTLNLTEIPESYISITSGLGDTPPDNLLLVPALHEDELIGVIEIAALKKFQDFEITFVNEVSKSLAATIVYARNNERTTQLLAKSQQQALEMAEQEEEMRQNMEELKATQEESTRREEEYKGMVDAIGNSVFIVEYDLQGCIRSANEKLCTFLGKKSDEISGKTHHQVFKGNLDPDESFWKTLCEKTCKTAQETITSGKRKEILKEHFAAVYKSDGVPVKFMNFIIKVSCV